MRTSKKRKKKECEIRKGVKIDKCNVKFRLENSGLKIGQKP